MKTISLIIFLLTSNLSLYSQNNSTLYSFFVAGHTYGNPGVNNVGFHPPFKQRFSYIQSRPEIEFGVLTGDIVSANPIAQDWNEIDADISTLGIPVYFAVGNHDMENRPLFESRYGTTYFSFIHNNDLFIILDPNIDGWSITGAQLHFLQNTINNNYLSTENVFVFFHQVLWRESTNPFNYIAWNSDAGRVSPVNFWSTIAPIFNTIPNDVFMFAGDLGASWSTNVTYDRYNNIRLMASGMGDQDGENFIVVNVNSDKSVDYDLICLSDSNVSCLGELTSYLMVDSVPSFSCTTFPNPANQYFTISANQKGTLQLFDIKGKLVLEVPCNGLPDQKINISDLNKGVYIARANSDKGLITQKIVIE